MKKIREFVMGGEQLIELLTLQLHIKSHNTPPKSMHKKGCKPYQSFI